MLPEKRLGLQRYSLMALIFGNKPSDFLLSSFSQACFSAGLTIRRRFVTAGLCVLDQVFDRRVFPTKGAIRVPLNLYLVER